MQGMERKGYKYRFDPTEDQARERAWSFGCVRYVYNGVLAPRTEAWFEHHKRIDYAETDRLLVRMKRDVEKSWLTKVSCVPLQEALRYFAAGRAQYPHFHRKHDRERAAYQIGGFRWKEGTLAVAEMNARLDTRWARPVDAEPTGVTVRNDPAGRSFVSFSTEDDVARLPEVNASVGLDLGSLDTVVLATGERVG